MNIYILEMKKILRRKSCWILFGIVFFSFLIQTFIEVNNINSMMIEFGVAAGYRRFLDISELFLVFAFVIEIIVLSPFFCEDKQIGIKDLLKSTVNGRMNDYIARVLVSLTIILGLNFLIIFIVWILCRGYYGCGDYNLLLNQIAISDSALNDEYILTFITYYLFNVLFASIFLTSIVACVSTFFEKTRYSEIVVAAIVFMPAILEGILKNNNLNIGYAIVTGQPLMLITWRTLIESWSIFSLHLFLAIILSSILFFIGMKRWCVTSEF